MSVIQLIDSYTKELVNYETVANSDGLVIDGIVYRKKGNEVYRRRFEGSVNVKWFGAVGDGVNDDSNAIQQAIEFCKVNRKNFIKEKNNSSITNPLSVNTVYFPSGVYKVNKSIKVPSFVSLKGENKESTIIRTLLTGINVIDFSIDSSDINKFETFTYSYTKIENLTIAGKWFNTNPFNYKFDPPNRGLGNGIYTKNNIRLQLINVRCSGLENAGFMSDNCYYLPMIDCQFDNNLYGMLLVNTTTTVSATSCDFRLNSIGVLIKDSFSNYFERCIFESNVANFLPLPSAGDENVSNTKSGQGISIINSFNNTFRSCYIEENLSTIILSGAKHNLFDGCLFCPNTSYSSVNGYISNRWITFYNTENIGNRFLNNHFVEMNEVDYPSKSIEIKQADFGSDNLIDCMDKQQYDSILSHNDWATRLSGHELNAPVVINKTTADVYIGLQSKKSVV